MTHIFRPFWLIEQFDMKRKNFIRQSITAGTAMLAPASLLSREFRAIAKTGNHLN